MNMTITHTDCWTRGDARIDCRAARRTAPPRRDARARLLAYVFAGLGLALAAYGERFVLAEAPAPIVESAIASCAAELFGGSEAFTPACTPQAPWAAKAGT